VLEHHANYFQSFADEAATNLRGPKMVSWLGRIRLEVDNIRIMFDWMLKNRPKAALGLAGRLFNSRVYWITPHEARSLLEASIESATRDEREINEIDLAAAQIGLGLQLHNQGNYQASARSIEKGFELARRKEDPLLIVRGLNAKLLANSSTIDEKTLQLAEEAVAISRQNDFKVELAFALGITAYANIFAGNSEKGHQYLEEAIELAREFGNLWMIAALLRVRGNINQTLGDLNEARQYYEEALEALQPLGNRYAVNAIRSDLAENLRMSGENEAAEALYRETLIGWQEEGHQPMIAHQLECFAYLAMARYEYLHAAKIIGAAEAIREDMAEDSRLPSEKTEFAEAMDILKESLGEAELEAAIEAGHQMSTDEAIKYASLLK
jgi:tetratricopeptide (TPR) repeat protein